MVNDLISRREAIDAVEIMPFDDYGDYEKVRDLIEQLPAAELDYDLDGYSERLWKAAYERGKAEVKRNGKWRITTPISYKYTGYRCSECNELVYGKTNYCPCCGSYMGAYTRGGYHGNK